MHYTILLLYSFIYTSCLYSASHNTQPLSADEYRMHSHRHKPHMCGLCPNESDTALFERDGPWKETPRTAKAALLKTITCAQRNGCNAVCCATACCCLTVPVATGSGIACALATKGCISKTITDTALALCISFTPPALLSCVCFAGTSEGEYPTACIAEDIDVATIAYVARPDNWPEHNNPYATAEETMPITQ